jgi:predicted CXXCH cytochrome family protein
LAEPDLVPSHIEEPPEEGQEEKQRRWPLLLLLLLLLLLCSVTSVANVFIDRNPDEARFIARNLECLQCHTELIPDFDRASVHQPFMLRECTVCHTPHGKDVTRTIVSGGSTTLQEITTVLRWLPLKVVLGVWDSFRGVETVDEGGVVLSVTEQELKGADSQLVLPRDELCWLCHGNLRPQLTASYQHNPFEQGYCTTCHNPHASEYRVLLIQDKQDLCVTCHPYGIEFTRDQRHPPAAQRFCLDCHHPHASDYRGILVDNQRDLCFGCHPTVATLAGKAVQHNPFAYDNCTGCHEPHSSNFLPLLLKNQPPLCYDCHPGIRNDFQQASYHPVGTRQLNCADCHNPHAADYSALLIAQNNDLCFTCHTVDPDQVTYDTSGHGAWGRPLCIECHTPHGSPYAPILRDSNPQLCLNCHPFMDSHDNQHPVTPAYYDPVAQTGLTCSSTCHDPHGTPYNFMLQNFYYPADGQCLQCHTRVGIDY